MDTNTTPKPKTLGDIFETQSCSRCGGSGHYSYCTMYGTKCFKCGGTKRFFTKHGQRDLARYQAAVDAVTLKPVADLKPGDSCKLDNEDMRRYHRVASIELGESSCSRLIDGEWVRHAVYRVTFERPIMMVGFMGRYTMQTFEVPATAQVRIHPGNGNMPVAENFVTPVRKRKAVA